MLGIKTNQEPVGGEIGLQIRYDAFRIGTGKYNEADRQSMEKSRKAFNRYKAVWK